MKQLLKELSYEKLGDRMIIHAYTGFNMRYQHITPEVCRWLKHNFKGTHVKVLRDGQNFDFDIEKLEEGDTVNRIHKFPAALKKLTIVNARLIQELKKRGFVRFIVQDPPKPQNERQVKLAKGRDHANKLVEKVKETIVFRDEAVDAVEDMLDNARNNKISAKEVVGYVNKITESASDEALVAMISLKESDQTYAHCVDVAALFATTYFNIQERKKQPIIFKDKTEALLSGFMHDFGKSKIPKEILDSTKRFDRDGPEMKMMLAHPVKSAELLNKMGLPDYLVNMAHYHHVKMNTNMASSYPQGVDYNNVLPETRLLAIIDIYQALVGKRSYKKSWAPPAAVRYLDALSDVEFDGTSWNDFLKVTGKYPQSSLVELSDGSAGFVMNVPEVDLERPQIVIVRNGSGEILKSNTFVDLEFEKDLSIVKDLDAQDEFDNKALDVFMKIQAA